VLQVAQSLRPCLISLLERTLSKQRTVLFIFSELSTTLLIFWNGTPRPRPSLAKTRLLFLAEKAAVIFPGGHYNYSEKLPTLLAINIALHPFEKNHLQQTRKGIRFP
jgi:hypothetical protein